MLFNDLSTSKSSREDKKFPPNGSFIDSAGFEPEEPQFENGEDPGISPEEFAGIQLSQPKPLWFPSNG